MKAKCGDDLLKFHLSSQAKKLDLENQVLERLNDPSVKSPKIKYLDEDSERPLIACDQDWKECVQITSQDYNYNVC